MVTMLRGVLNHRVTVGGALESLMWLAIPYILVGLVVTFFHPQYVDMLTPQLARHFPAGAELVAFGQITLMWPGLLLTGNLCMV